MTTLNKLEHLSPPEQRRMALNIGSYEELYRKVFQLYQKDYLLFKAKPNGFEKKLEQIKSELERITATLNNCGLNGQSILENISADHEESVIENAIMSLNEYMQHHSNGKVSLQVCIEKISVDNKKFFRTNESPLMNLWHKFFMRKEIKSLKTS